MFAQESVMDIQNIVTEQDTETLDAEIAAMTAAFTEEHYLNNDEAEHLEMIAAKSMVLGELYERAKWQAKAQAVPEGFVLLPIKDAKFFSHDGDNYEVHDTLVEAKYEAECAMEHYRERLADQLSDPRSDGNFQNVGYGVVLAKPGYSIDHVVTQDDIDQGNYPYEVGTEILSLFLVEAQEQNHV